MFIILTCRLKKKNINKCYHWIKIRIKFNLQMCENNLMVLNCFIKIKEKYKYIYVKN